MNGRSKEATFGFIKDHICHKINSWSSKCIPKAGREVMIKSVLQSIPSYVMSIYLLLNKLVDVMEKLLIFSVRDMVAPLEEVCIGYIWKDYISIKVMVEWGLRTSHLLMWQSLANKGGSFK